MLGKWKHGITSCGNVGDRSLSQSIREGWGVEPYLRRVKPKGAGEGKCEDECYLELEVFLSSVL